MTMSDKRKAFKRKQARAAQHSSGARRSEKGLAKKRGGKDKKKKVSRRAVLFSSGSVGLARTSLQLHRVWGPHPPYSTRGWSEEDGSRIRTNHPLLVRTLQNGWCESSTSHVRRMHRMAVAIRVLPACTLQKKKKKDLGKMDRSKKTKKKGMLVGAAVARNNPRFARYVLASPPRKPKRTLQALIGRAICGKKDVVTFQEGSAAAQIVEFLGCPCDTE